MKELSIEQKAQRYDEAIERAKQWRNAPNVGKIPTFANRVIEEIFPELKESEDERIRKELLEHCKNQAKPYIQTGNKCPQIQSWIAWLEKQGEKKELKEIEQRIGDNIPQDFQKYVEHLLSLSDGEGHGSPAKVKEVSAELFKLAKLEQNPWSKEDERSIRDSIFYLKSAKKYFEKDNDILWDEKWFNLCIEWLESLYKRLQPQPKQEWSEEDVNFIEATIGLLNLVTPIDAASWGKSRLDCVDWLKSLKDRVGCEVNCTTTKEWKPSDEQIGLLQAIVNDPNNASSESCQIVLKEVIRQLKKLREE